MCYSGSVERLGQEAHDALTFFMPGKEDCRMALTEKQKRFCDEYLIDLNATQAAIRAGYSVKTAEQQGHQLLKKTSVQHSIARAMAERSKRTGINQDRIIQELAKLAFVKITDVVDDKGRIIPDASGDDLACIEGIKYKETENGVEREVKIASKQRALEALGRHLGMWNDKLDIGVDGEISISIDYGDGVER